jgi:uncharacterized spore protein YtfJ
MEHDVRMQTDDILARVGAGLGVRRVFGEPVEREGTTVIPVAMVAGGGGGGEAPGGTPGGPPGATSGGGFGGYTRGIGVYVLRDGQVRFVPATDRTLIAVVAILVWGRVMLRIVRGIARNRHDRDAR